MAEETDKLSEAFMEVPVPRHKPLPYKEWIKSFSDKENIIATLLGESRGERVNGSAYEPLQGVGNVIDNRSKRKQWRNYTSFTDIVKQPNQFEVWKVSSDPKLNKIYDEIADLLLKGELKDITEGSDHFVNPKKITDENKLPSRLTNTIKIHNHQFMNSLLDSPFQTPEKFLRKKPKKPFVESTENVILSPPPAPVVEQPDWDFIKKIIPELTGLELEQRSQFDGHELWNKATETIEKYPNDPRKARMYFLKDIITNPDNAIYTNIITGESIELPKIGKKEGGLIQKYQKGDLVGPSTEPKTGFFNVSGGYSEKKRKPVGKINKNTPVVRGSEQKGISMQLQLPRAITDKIIKGLRLGGEYSEEKFIEKLSASNLFNEKMKTEIKKSGITVGKDKFDISLNKTSFKPEGQKSKNQYDAYGRFTVDKSPLGEITVNLNVEDFTGKRPQYGVSLRKEIKFKEGGFVSA